MNIKSWDLKCLEEKIKIEEKEISEKSLLKYDDNYITDQKNYCAFQAVCNFLASNLDYSEKNLNKIDSIECLKDKLKNELDIGILANSEQRFNNVTFQHPNTQ